MPVRQVVKALVCRPWYTLSISAVMAIASALMTTVFAVLDGVLFKPLGYPDGRNLVSVELAAGSGPQLEAAALAREGHELVVATGRAPKTREAGRKTAAGQEVLKRALNKPGQSWPVTSPRRLRAERLVVLAHDLMERALLGPTRAIAEGGGHGTAVRRKACALSAKGFSTANRIAALDTAELDFHRRSGMDRPSSPFIARGA